MERKGQQLGLDRWEKSLVVGPLEVEVAVVGPVGFEIQTRRERIARNVDGM